MRRVRPFAMSLSLVAACAALTGCSPDRQSGVNEMPKPIETAAEAPQSQPIADSSVTSYSQQTPESAAAISGLEMPDSKSMLITDESMTSSLSAPAADPIAPHGQSMPRPPIMPALAK